MMIIILLILVCYAQSVVLFPNISNQEKLSDEIRTNLERLSYNRDFYIITQQNIHLYLEKRNLSLSMLPKEYGLEFAKTIQANFLLLGTYENVDSKHSLSISVYNTESDMMQKQFNVDGKDMSDLKKNIPSLINGILIQLLIDRGMSDPLDYPFVSVPKGNYVENNKRKYIDSFLIGKYEVSQALFFTLMQTNPTVSQDCDSPRSSSNFSTPVSCVNFIDAARFANEFSLLQGRKPCYTIHANQSITRLENCMGCRLPSSDEWIYAASFGKKTKYAGSEASKDVAWTKENSNGIAHLPGKLKPNALNIYDMSGNVMEWTETQSDESYIVRGGSFYLPEDYSRVSKEEYLDATTMISDQGLRLVCSP